MRKKFITLLVLSFALIVNAQSNFISFPCSTTPTIDGKRDFLEWVNSDSVIINLDATGEEIKVFFMKDYSNLYVMYAGNLESRFRFPELLIDANNSKSSFWETDDWWFHVSATDCENSGAFSVYNNCKLNQLGWDAKNNITQGTPMTDTVEIKIPFEKLGLTAGISQTIGISFSTSGLFGSTISYSWPSNTNVLDPSSWAVALLNQCSYNYLNQIEDQFSFSVIQNSQDQTILIETSDDSYSTSFEVKTVCGKTIITGGLHSGKNVLSHSLNAGLYLVTIKGNHNRIQTKKLLIIK